MEVAGRAGGLIATNRIALRDLVLLRRPRRLGARRRGRSSATRRSSTSCSTSRPSTPTTCSSSPRTRASTARSSAWRSPPRQTGHKLIAVTSLDHTNAVTPKHPSGKRLSEIADVVIDNLAPFGDTTLDARRREDDRRRRGLVDHRAFIAQLLTIGSPNACRRRRDPPVYISANIPGGDEHNHALEDRYRGRIRRLA